MKSESDDGLRDGGGATDLPSWTVKDGKEPVAGRADLSTPMPFQFVPDDLGMCGEEVAPTGVTERGERPLS